MVVRCVHLAFATDSSLAAVTDCVVSLSNDARDRECCIGVPMDANDNQDDEKEAAKEARKTASDPDRRLRICKYCGVRNFMSAYAGLLRPLEARILPFLWIDFTFLLRAQELSNSRIRVHGKKPTPG